MNLIEKAKQFAHDAHDFIGQKRKYSGENYWVHTDEVAAIVATVTENEFVIAAAHLHDTVEDVNQNRFTIVDISKTFGLEVASLVRELTDVYTREAYPGLNRAMRKDLEARRLGTISAEAQTIKVADIISNSKDILAQDEKFAKVYLKEKEVVLSYLTKANPILLERAKNHIDKS
jgi:(p)ppGpp synthase/HD superfamily hydrolase